MRTWRWSLRRAVLTQPAGSQKVSQGCPTDISQVVGCAGKLWALWILLFIFYVFKFFCKNKCMVTSAASQYFPNRRATVHSPHGFCIIVDTLERKRKGASWIMVEQLCLIRKIPWVGNVHHGHMYLNNCPQVIESLCVHPF